MSKAAAEDRASRNIRKEGFIVIEYFGEKIAVPSYHGPKVDASHRLSDVGGRKRLCFGDQPHALLNCRNACKRNDLRSRSVASSRASIRHTSPRPDFARDSETPLQ
jgi:hypothetical protein